MFRERLFVVQVIAFPRSKPELQADRGGAPVGNDEVGFFQGVIVGQIVGVEEGGELGTQTSTYCQPDLGETRIFDPEVPPGRAAPSPSKEAVELLDDIDVGPGAGGDQTEIGRPVSPSQAQASSCSVLGNEQQLVSAPEIVLWRSSTVVTRTSSRTTSRLGISQVAPSMCMKDTRSSNALSGE